MIALTAERIELWSNGAMVGRAGIVVSGEDLPEVIMVDGIPFVPAPDLGAAAYRQVRPYCISTPAR